MKRLALGVAAMLVATAGSVATAAPGGRNSGDWCEKNADAGARPEIEKEKPVAAGGGRRDGKIPNAFACYDASAQAADQHFRLGAVVNAWADHENGAVRLSCVPQPGSAVSERCNERVRLPAKADAAPPSASASAPTESEPARATVDDQPEEPLVTVEVAGVRSSTDMRSVCIEVDATPLCRENPGGR